jgi:hypothetical protein
MTTYELSSERPLAFPSDRLMVHVEPSAGAQLQMRVDDGAATETFPPPRNYGAQWLVQNPAAYGLDSGNLVLVSTEPVFPAGFVCRATVDFGGTGKGPVVTVGPLDFSGLRVGELLQVAVDRAGDRPMLRLSLPKDDVPSVDPTLSDNARHALTQVRSRLNIQVVDPAERINTVVCVDGSASMVPLASSGDVAVVVDSLHGLAQVLSIGKSFRVGLVADRVRWLPTPSSKEGEPESPGGVVARWLVDSPALIGGVMAQPELVHSEVDENTMVFIVTDGIPPDAAQIAKAAEVPGEARHLVLIGGGYDEQQVFSETGLSTSVWRPGLLPGDADYERTIFGLLRSCFDPTTANARKLS